MSAGSSRAEPREGFVQAGPLRLHYVTWGESDRSVVCLHGTGGNARHWGSLARTLVPQGYRVIGFDQRGHGDSDQPERGYEVDDFVGDLEAALPALGITRFDLVGASLGSRVALVYAARHPAQIGKLVLVDLSFEMPEAEQQRMIQGHRDRPDSFGSLEEVEAWSRGQPGRFRWEQQMHAELAPYEVKQLPDGRWTWRYSRQAAVLGLEAARRNLWPYAEALQVPTLVVRGAESPVLTPEAAEQMSRRIPNVRLVEVERAGHGVPRDNPAGFNQVVVDFLKQ
jgi:pimeloyl-ACP methyl ester carboxylesterase